MSDDFKYPFFIMNIASTDESDTSDAPVSNTKHKGKLLIAHFTLQIPSSLLNGISIVCFSYTEVPYFTRVAMIGLN